MRQCIQDAVMSFGGTGIMAICGTETALSASILLLALGSNGICADELIRIASESSGPCLLWRADFNSGKDGTCIPGINGEATIVREGGVVFARFEPLKVTIGGKQSVKDTFQVNTANGYLNADWFGSLDVRLNFRMRGDKSKIQVTLKEGGYRPVIPNSSPEKRIEFGLCIIEFAPDILAIRKTNSREKPTDNPSTWHRLITPLPTLESDVWSQVQIIEDKANIHIYVNSQDVCSFPVPEGCGGACVIRSIGSNDFKELAIFEVGPRPYHSAYEAIRKQTEKAGP